MRMNRHEFLKTMAAAGIAATSGVTSLSTAFGQGSECDLVAVMGGEPEAMLQKALEALGGIGRFVKKGDKVVIKPNIGWDKAPELAANTNPQLVAAIVKAALGAGASQVTVFDNTCDEWRACYKSSGIEEAAIAAGAKVVPGNDESYYQKVQLPEGKVLKTTLIHKAILESDVWINVPVLKNHGGAKMTIAMKNLMGIVWDRRFFHNNDLHQCIADVCTFEKRPALNIVDAYRVMKTNGPRGIGETDVVEAKGLFASTDIVAVDTAATRFFDQIEKMPLADVGYLEKGEEHKLGTTDIGSLNVKRIRL